MNWIWLVTILLITACNDVHQTGEVESETTTATLPDDQVTRPAADIAAIDASTPDAQTINTHNVTPQELVQFAKTMIGTPYLYASVDPSKGFDCSGFITYVFNHFQIKVPRSSIDFTSVRNQVPLEEAKPGDLILFTGTDSNVHEVGHMGIITSGGVEKAFIHSTSGRAHGVTITPLNEYYMRRFVKIIRVFSQNDAN